jgi:hypothetical protein
VLVVCVFALIAHTSLAFFDHPVRQQFVGAVSMASLISMFASPLAVMVRLNFQRELLSNFIKKESSWVIKNRFLIVVFFPVMKGVVIRTECVEFMPFYLSLSTLLMSASFALYGLLLRDFFIYVSPQSSFRVYTFRNQQRTRFCRWFLVGLTAIFRDDFRSVAEWTRSHPWSDTAGAVRVLQQEMERRGFICTVARLTKTELTGQLVVPWPGGVSKESDLDILSADVVYTSVVLS